MKRRPRLLVAAALLGLPVVTGTWVMWPLPAGLTAPPQVMSLQIEDRYGMPLRTTRAADGSRAQWLAIADLDPQLIGAFVATEDRRFFAHHGVDIRAVARAIGQNVRQRRAVSGASTITMQVARLLHPAPRGWLAKFSQALWAVRLERHLTKQQIMEQYLNRVPLGQGVVGVGAAAALYFDASAARLSLGQSALLAGLASAPSTDNPLVDRTRAGTRRAAALRRMVGAGFVADDAAARAAEEPLMAADRPAPFLAPHFTSRLLEAAADSGRTAGTWRTSLDLVLQAELESEVRHTVALLRDRGVAEAAAVVLANRTGEVLAWVGSPDFWSDSAGQVDMVVSPRQPGSALKPFLYALAFDHGYSPASVLPDTPRSYATPTGPYQPRNYDRRYHGPVRMREALASSFNVPAVELTDRFGAATFLRVLHDAGFASLDRPADHYGLGLVIGNGDVTLLELANGYRGLLNGGEWTPYRFTRVEAGEESRPPETGTRFVSPAAAALVLDVLNDPAARVPGFGVETPFDFPFPVAVKTGTSHHFTDNWAIGVTGEFTVAVWAGNFTGRPMRQVSGVTGAGPLLHRAIMDVARRYQPGVLPSPAAFGAVRVTVCRLSGLRAGPRCPGTDEWVLPDTHLADCGWHAGGGPVSWPAEYAEWARTAAPEDGGAVAVAAEAGAEAFRIVAPQDGDRYQIPAAMDERYATIALRAAGDPADEPVRWLVDGRALRAPRWQLAPGSHRVRAVSARGRTAEVAIDVR